jgi:hypothetical protein
MVQVIYCIGESLDERNSGKTIEVCKSQLEPVKVPYRLPFFVLHRMKPSYDRNEFFLFCETVLHVNVRDSMVEGIFVHV